MFGDTKKPGRGGKMKRWKKVRSSLALLEDLAKNPLSPLSSGPAEHLLAGQPSSAAAQPGDAAGVQEAVGEDKDPLLGSANSIAREEVPRGPPDKVDGSEKSDAISPVPPPAEPPPVRPCDSHTGAPSGWSASPSEMSPPQGRHGLTVRGRTDSGIADALAASERNMQHTDNSRPLSVSDGTDGSGPPDIVLEVSDWDVLAKL
eukprot:gnl/TRDRNA2_/TRDRNA2_166523_c0_seq1.p1 gnl/TRDRNA2_/TRDRNA2_166523_c0~~gnl/TRDRNA2_/TRDRNA2_166523_c0_seq1.p1  ORF type:complete len:223 (+),score=26.43 gnl/TRDRNA2_/TRDRNA2_166523_c0_seq1:62-670(+)